MTKETIQKRTINRGERTRAPVGLYTEEKELEKATKILCFDGHGAQYVGMGKENYRNFKFARDLHKIACEIYHFNITDLMFNGQEKDLTQTGNAHRAIPLNNLVSLMVLKHKYPEFFDSPVSFVTGQSLGIFNAGLEAGVFGEGEEGIRSFFKTVDKRGELFQKISDQPVKTGLIHVHGNETEMWQIIEKLLRMGLYPAIIKSRSEIIFGGTIEQIVDVQKNFKGSSEVKGSSAAFHTPHMDSVVKPFEELIMNTKLYKASVDIITNTHNPVKKISEPKDVAEEWIDLVNKPVYSLAIDDFLEKLGMVDLYEMGDKGFVSKSLLRNRTLWTITTLAATAGAIFAFKTVRRNSKKE